MVVCFVILDTKISMITWLEKQVQGNSWYRLGSLFDQTDVKSRDETEDNHDIIKLSREALQDSPAAAYCGGCCVTTPNTFYSFVLGDSDNTYFYIILAQIIGYWKSHLAFFFGVLQIQLYPAKAYHSQTKNIKVIFDFGGKFFARFKKKWT